MKGLSYPILERYLRIIVSYTIFVVFRVVPRKKNRWVFGSWFGKRASDNPRALFDFVQKNFPEIEMVWVTNEKSLDLPKCKIVKRNSFKGIFYASTASVAVFNQGFVDFCRFNVLGNSYKVQLWHGVPWKKIMFDAEPVPRMFIEKLMMKMVYRLYDSDVYITPSDLYANQAKSAFHTGFGKILKVGQPRNEVLFDNQFCIEAKKYLQQECNVGVDKKIVAYMPTFRDNNDYVESFSKLEKQKDIERLASQYDFVLIEKSHYVKSNNVTENDFKSVVVRPDIDAQLLLAGADLLITDYSSCFFDYLIRDNPIIHYVYDYDYYKNQDRGLYYDIEDVAAGSVAYDFEQLLFFLEKNLQNPNLDRKKRKMRREKYLPYESKDNCRIIVNRILRDLKQ